MSDVTVQNIRIRVKDTGYGKPILFIHGHPDTADLWDDVIQHMPTDGYRYIRPDLPGYGQSGDGKGFDLSIENRGKWVADLLEAIGVHEKVVVVGHDHGGPFAASYAVQYDQNISHLVLMNTLFHSDYDWHMFAVLWRLPLVGEYTAFWQKFSFMRPIIKWYVQRSEPAMTDEHIIAMQKNMTPKMNQQMLRLYRATTPSELGEWEDKLHDFINRKPTLVLWGEQDKYLPLKFAVRMNTHGAQLATFPDAGHWAMITKPKAIAQKIIRFIETS